MPLVEPTASLRTDRQTGSLTLQSQASEVEVAERHGDIRL